LDSLLSFVCQRMGADRAAICLVHKGSGKVFIHRRAGLVSEKREGGLLDLGDEALARVCETGQSVVSPKALGGPPPLGRPGGAGPAADTQGSFACVPISRAGKTIGCISSEGRFGSPEGLQSHAEAMAAIAGLLAGPADLFMLESIDKAAWERRAQSLAGELGELRSRYRPSYLVGSSKGMQEVYFLIRKVASKKTTVLLLGESGVGKDIVANAIHCDGLMPSGPFVKFGCASHAEAMAESRLFGVEREPFSGAVFRKGRLEAADGGTIFLDEISQLPLGAQAKLLRVLQESAFERVGGSNPVRADARVIASSTRDLAELVAKGRFLEELYYRLSVFPILIPPLREREGDISSLARHFLAKFSEAAGKGVKSISPQADAILSSYDWPGNVKELESVMLRAVILAEDAAVQPHDLPLAVKSASGGGRRGQAGLAARLSSIEHEMLTEALRLHQGNISAAAKGLGLTRRSMGLRMKRLNLGYKQFRPAQGPSG
jgi:Nif-specific regulatory protein